jgi:hypothetical protein
VPNDHHATRKTQELRETFDGYSVGATASTGNAPEGSFAELPPGVGPLANRLHGASEPDLNSLGEVLGCDQTGHDLGLRGAGRRQQVDARVTL